MFCKERVLKWARGRGGRVGRAGKKAGGGARAVGVRGRDSNSITNDQINNIRMNLKYNRIDMKKRVA